MQQLVIRNNKNLTLINDDLLQFFKKTINNETVTSLSLISKEKNDEGYPRLYVWVLFDLPAIALSFDDDVDLHKDIDYSSMICTDDDYYDGDHKKKQTDYLNSTLKTIDVNLDHLEDFLMNRIPE